MSLVIPERDFASWFDKLEEHLISVPPWQILLIYRDVSAIEAGRRPMYYGFLQAMRSPSTEIEEATRRDDGQSGWPTKAYRLYRRVRTGEIQPDEALTLIFGRIEYRLRMSLPSLQPPAVDGSPRVLILEAFSVNLTTLLPVAQRLTHEFGWEILFGSWNHKLENPVRQAGLNYVHVENLFRRRYLEMKSRHTQDVTQILGGLDTREPSAVLRELSGTAVHFDAYNLLRDVCTRTRTLTDVYYELLAVYQPDIIVLANEISPPGRTMANVAAAAGIPTVALQHGLFAERPLYHRLSTDKLLVWGPVSKDFWLMRGCSPERLEITGAIRYESWIEEGAGGDTVQSNHSEPLVLVASQPLGTDLPLSQHRATLKAVLDTALELPEVQFAYKLHPAETPKPYQVAITASGAKNVKLIPEGPIAPLIKACNLLITIFSTTGLEAMLLDRPVLMLHLSAEPPLAPYARAGAAFLVTEAECLPEAITRILQDPALRRSLTEAGRQFIQDYLGPLDGRTAYRAAQAIVQTVVAQDHNVQEELRPGKAG